MVPASCGGWALQPRLAAVEVAPGGGFFSLDHSPSSRREYLVLCGDGDGVGWCYSGGGDGESEGGDTASLAADTFSPFALPLPLSRAVVAAASHGSRALFVRTENGLHT